MGRSLVSKEGGVWATLGDEKSPFEVIIGRFEVVEGGRREKH